jgi:hypothetical protein
MKLKELRITRSYTTPYVYKGEIVFDGEAGSVALILTEKHIERLFDMVADSVVAVARDAAENLTAKALEHKSALLDSKP